LDIFVRVSDDCHWFTSPGNIWMTLARLKPNGGMFNAARLAFSRDSKTTTSFVRKLMHLRQRIAAARELKATYLAWQSTVSAN
jgi:hypothetical protein